MKLLFYRYGSICEPSIINIFKRLHFTVTEDISEVTNKNITPGECAAKISNYLIQGGYSFVFSINFYPAISEICNYFQIPYICWVVDCPVLELYSDTIRNPVNQIFIFDKTMYLEFYPENPKGIHYMPLAADTFLSDSVCQKITAADRRSYCHDISFIGSLYSEKSPLSQQNNLPAFMKGYLDGLIEAQLKIYGCNFIRDSLPPDMVAEFKSLTDFYKFPENANKNDTAVMSDWYIGMRIAELERTRTLNALSEHFNVDLYTRSDVSSVPKVRNHGPAMTLTEMPKIFNLSKINLNMTIKPIQSGLSLRIWDILGAGGFLMTNYQSELPDYFEIGKHLEAYSSIEELLDKCRYYLTHEEERAAIARRGYELSASHHTYDARISEILKCI